MAIVYYYYVLIAEDHGDRRVIMTGIFGGKHVHHISEYITSMILFQCCSYWGGCWLTLF